MFVSSWQHYRILYLYMYLFSCDLCSLPALFCSSVVRKDSLEHSSLGHFPFTLMGSLLDIVFLVGCFVLSSYILSSPWSQFLVEDHRASYKSILADDISFTMLLSGFFVTFEADNIESFSFNPSWRYGGSWILVEFYSSYFLWIS